MFNHPSEQRAKLGSGHQASPIRLDIQSPLDQRFFLLGHRTYSNLTDTSLSGTQHQVFVLGLVYLYLSIECLPEPMWFLSWSVKLGFRSQRLPIQVILVQVSFLYVRADCLQHQAIFLRGIRRELVCSTWCGRRHLPWLQVVFLQNLLSEKKRIL